MKTNLKKTLTVFLSLFFLTAFTYAQELMDEPSVYSETGAVVSQEDSTLTAEATEEISTENTEETQSEIVFKKTNLAKAEKVKTAIFLNLLPGFGCGSFVQGDKLGGSLGAVFSTVTVVGVAGYGVITFVYALGGALGGAFAGGVGGNASDTATDIINEALPYQICFGILAGGGLLANIIWGIARPINYKKTYLAKNGLSLNLMPVISSDKVGAVAILRF